jgi:hypothetical protein
MCRSMARNYREPGSADDLSARARFGGRYANRSGRPGAVTDGRRSHVTTRQNDGWLAIATRPYRKPLCCQEAIPGVVGARTTGTGQYALAGGRRVG